MQAIHWINPTGGDFTDGADWSGGVVPGAGDNAVIDASGTYTVTLSSAETVGSLTLDADATVSLGNGAHLTVGANLTLRAGQLLLGGGATISGGTLQAKGGKFVWGNGTLDGVTYEGPLDMKHRGSFLQIGPNGLVLTGRDDTGPGTANISRGGDLIFKGTQTFNNATVNLNNSDVSGDFTAGAVLTLGKNLSINHVNGNGNLLGGSVLNKGAINANSPSGVDFTVISRVFTNQGTMAAFHGDELALFSATFTNLVGGTLTGGDYEAAARSIFELGNNETVVTDDATITLSGSGSLFQSQNDSGQEVSIESTLTTIGADGTLKLLSGRDWTSTNAITNAGTLVLGGGTFAPSALTNSGMVSGSGGIGVAIANSGTIEAASSTLDLTQSITGSGKMTVDAAAILKVEGDASASLTTTFNGAGGVLGLGDAAEFASTITGFVAGDAIDVLLQTATSATLKAGDMLAVMNGTQTIATLQLSGNYTGDTFGVASDGHGGANITVGAQGAGVFTQAMSSMSGAPAAHTSHIPDTSRLRSPMLASPRAMFA